MAAERRARQRTHCSADRSASHAAVDSGIVGGLAAGLTIRVLPAIEIVSAELIETLACSGHRHDAGAGRYGHTRSDRQQRHEGQKTQ
jgi:hypothetical protein